MSLIIIKRIWKAKMLTIKEILSLSTEHLENAGVKNAKRQAEEMIADSLEMRRLDLFMQYERPLQSRELERCRDALKRRALGEPLQYIRGKVDFFDCIIHVSSDVLIPRQETEVLVDKMVGVISSEEKLDGKVLWDVCCGSGCIGIALKKRFPELRVVLSDLSAEALNVARENARLNEVDVEFLQGDLLAPFKGEKCDFFVCNPPYISETEYSELEIEVKGYEPKQALVGGESGLEYFEVLANNLSEHLTGSAKAWLEIGTGQGTALLRLFSKHSWRFSRVDEDWAGHERFFFLEKEDIFV
ncbi:MAG: release factor glutamine methyltransferase [Chlamydiales bacterium]